MLLTEAPGIIAFIFGLLVGSFINVLIYRIPRNISFVMPRSRCESCKSLIQWYQNIPVISFIVLWGKCSYCKKKISWRHPLVELMVGVAAYGLFPQDLSEHSLIFFFFFFAIYCAFVVHFFVDLDFQILPDGVNLYLAILFLAYSLFFHSWAHWLWGGIIGFGIPYTITWLFYKLRGKIGMGGGDIKLYGALGLYLGPREIVMTIFLSCLLGATIGLLLILCKMANRQTPIAFGPYIILAAVFQIFFPHYQKHLMGLIF